MNRKQTPNRKKMWHSGAGRFSSLAGQPLGKMFSIAMVLGLLSTGIVMMMVPEEAGGDGIGGITGNMTWINNGDGDWEIWSGILQSDDSLKDANQLTSNSVHDMHPSISPDGSKIVYVETADGALAGNGRVRKMMFNGSSNNYLTSPSNEFLFTHWGVNDKIVLNDQTGSKTNSISTIESDGSGLTEIYSGGDDQVHATWSPDATKVAWFSDKYSGSRGIRIADADGNNDYKLENTTPLYDYDQLSWSPDGTKIAYADKVGDYWQLFTIMTDDTEKTQITDFNWDSMSPEFIDDETLIFCSNEDGDFDIYMVTTDGTGKTQLTDLPGNELYPRFHRIESEQLRLSSDSSYYQGDPVTINATYTNGPANISFLVKNPYNQTYLVETMETDESGFTQLQFELFKDDPTGNWTIYATNDVDDSTANITFEVLPLPGLNLISLDFPSEINPGDTIHVDFVILNGFDTEQDILLALQLKDASLHALRPDIKEKTIDASTEKTWQLQVKIPKKAEPGEYFLQGQMLTGMPDEGGYVIDYIITSVIVTED